jgi:formiminoglutamase
MGDPHWPTAAEWLAHGTTPAEFTVLGIPTHATSISPTGAHATPAAVRLALQRYSINASGVDLRSLSIADAGDVMNPDGVDGEARVSECIREIQTDMLFGIGGDNSLTYSLCVSRWGQDITRAGLITFDAHHDIRDGISNGSPVRRLIEAGLSGERVVQVGIADFSNSPFYAQRARDYGITVISRSELRQRTIADVMDQALLIAGSAGGPIHVDLDLDVCDRSVVPACPAAAPGGISADELRQAARLAGADTRVRSIDIAEVDATRDSADQRTTRLGALCILEAAAGFISRPEPAGQ